MSLLLLFRKKARSARLLACKHALWRLTVATTFLRICPRCEYHYVLEMLHNHDRSVERFFNTHFLPYTFYTRFFISLHVIHHKITWKKESFCTLLLTYSALTFFAFSKYFFWYFLLRIFFTSFEVSSSAVMQSALFLYFLNCTDR